MKLYGNKKRSARPERQNAAAEAQQHVPQESLNTEDILKELSDFFELKPTRAEESAPTPAREPEPLSETPSEPLQTELPRMTPRTVRSAPEAAPRREHAPTPERPRARQEAAKQNASKNQQRLSAKTRALILCIAAACVFVASVVTCLLLINKSEAPFVIGEAAKPSNLKYEVNINPPAKVDSPVELTAPAGVNNSTTLNILLLAMDEKQEHTDTILLLNIDMVTREVGLLSIPRDTYISGNYDIPKINEVYAAAKGGERGIEALREKLKEMIGFWPDYYFVLDENVLTLALDSIGGLTFDVPSEAQYCSLPAGNTVLNGKTAIQLFHFNAKYDEISTKPTRVQRDFLQALLNELITKQDDETSEENVRTIIEAAQTNLTQNDLLYFLYLLKDCGFQPSVSEALPGEEITVDGEDYFEVDPKDACEQLNDGFNPFPNKTLTVYQLNFRQKTGKPTDGTYDFFGYTPTKTTKNTETEDTEETDETDETEETGETDETDETGDSSQTEESSETTEPSESGEATQPSSSLTPPTEGPDSEQAEASDVSEDS